MLTIKVDNLALDYAPPETVTQDNPLLLIHGAGGTSRYWENYLSYFSREGWEVYAINLRGHSPSDREAALAQVTLEDYVEDVEKVIRRRHLERCALIGHSLGGLIAQKTAEGFPLLSGLIMIGTAPPMGVAMELHHDVPYAGTVLKTMWGLMNMKPVKPTFMMAEKTILNNVRPEDRKKVFDMFVAESLVAGYQVAQGFPVVPSRIKCPRLVIGCGMDMIAPPYIQKSVADFLDADYFFYEQYAHLPMLEPGWEGLAADIAGWLREKTRPPRH